MTADINKTVIKGTPLHSSIKPIEEYFIAGKSDLLPKAKKTPIGKQKISANAETIKVSDKPPQLPVLINFKPNIPPEIRFKAISGNIKKFDIKDYGFKEQGFLSGDLNVEWFVMPNEKFTPFVYAGPGLLISNDFNDKNYKLQGGAGLEYLFNPNMAVVGSLEVN